MPRYGEQHPPIRRLRNHQRRTARQKRVRQNKMRSLAHRKQRSAATPSMARISSVKTPLALTTTFACTSNRTSSSQSRASIPTVFPSLLQQPNRLDIVDRRPSQILKRPQQGDRIPRIVELSIVIQNAAAQPLARNSRQHLQLSAPARAASMRPTKAFPTSAHTPSARSHSREAKNSRTPALRTADCGPGAARSAAYVRAPADASSTSVMFSLLKIPNPAMHQLGAAARRSLGKIESLHQHRAIAARSGFYRRAQSTGSAADNQHIPRLACFAQPP